MMADNHRRKFFYLCDRKPGACPSWKKYAWTECESLIFCKHTTNPQHAKNKAFRKYRLHVTEDGVAEYWEKEENER